MSEEVYCSPLEPDLPEKPGERRYWGRLYGCSKALALNTVATHKQRLFVIITASLSRSYQLQEELGFFGKDSVERPPFMSFPDWETLPYDLFSPYQDITSERLATLAQLPTLQHGVLVVPVSTLMHRLMPRSYMIAHSLMLATGQVLDIKQFRDQLLNNGYRFVAQVIEHGDVAIRGSIIDIYPMGTRLPYRIDLLDQEIDSIRTFDPENQRSIETMRSIRILPAREVAMLEENINLFRSNWRMRFEGNPNQSSVYKDVSDGIAPAGIEYYLPLFFQETQSLFEYINQDCTVVLDEGVTEAAEDFWQDVENRYEQARYDQQRPILAPKEVFYHPQDFYSQIKAFPQIHITGLSQNDNRAGTINYASQIPVNLPIDARANDPLVHVKRFLDEYTGRSLIVAESTGRRETILELFNRNGLRLKQFSHWSDFLAADDKLGITVAMLEQGTQLLTPAIAIISESQLFGERVHQRRLRKRKQQDTDAIVRNLTELIIGAPVVHEEHGVGRYHGLVTLDAGGIPAEYLLLEYDQGDKLYVPVASLELISRYTGVDPEHAPLHRLGSGQWQKPDRKLLSVFMMWQQNYWNYMRVVHPDQDISLILNRMPIRLMFRVFPLKRHLVRRMQSMM